ncbi:MAG: transcriptional regulator, MerR family, partial [uncultured Rubrobacteraceae bacterium]
DGQRRPEGPLHHRRGRGAAAQGVPHALGQQGAIPGATTVDHPYPHTRGVPSLLPPGRRDAQVHPDAAGQGVPAPQGHKEAHRGRRAGRGRRVGGRPLARPRGPDLHQGGARRRHRDRDTLRRRARLGRGDRPRRGAYPTRRRDSAHGPRDGQVLHPAAPPARHHGSGRTRGRHVQTDPQPRAPQRGRAARTRRGKQGPAPRRSRLEAQGVDDGERHRRLCLV